MPSNYTLGKETIVSAPGKVMVLGGYLVLSKLKALTLALSAKFKVKVSNGSSLTIESRNFNKVWEIHSVDVLLII